MLVGVPNSGAGEAQAWLAANGGGDGRFTGSSHR
jgi:hypothetical protein